MPTPSLTPTLLLSAALLLAAPQARVGAPAFPPKSAAGAAVEQTAMGTGPAAVLADSVSVWRRLLAIASDTGHVARATRRDAMFWVGRFATAKVLGHDESPDEALLLDDLIGDRQQRYRNPPAEDSPTPDELGPSHGAVALPPGNRRGPRILCR